VDNSSPPLKVKARRIPRGTRARVAQPNIPAGAPLRHDLRGFATFGCLLIGSAILAVYSQTFDYGFVSLDDDSYVYDNPMIRTGLSHGLIWAFTTFHSSNWHPLTWISFMADWDLFGLNASAEHAVNVFFHLGAAVLLFLALVSMTRQNWRSAFVAGIFALHPMHVESVAWIAERKDVLSAFFLMLTLLFYARYVRNPNPRRYVAMVLAFALSLLAKPMAVTLPFVLVLLDLWPLRRFEFRSGQLSLKRLLWEKAPLFAMSIASSVVTYLAQGTSVMPLARLPVSERVENAVFAYSSYIGKAFWPAGLAVLYPIHKPAALGVFAAALTLSGVTVSAVLGCRRRPYVLVGWLWFLGVLVPVIGLVQVGVQSMADRYSYIPFVGLSIVLVWTIGDICHGRLILERTAITVGILALVVLAAEAYQQAKYWKTSTSLYQHALAVTYGNSRIQSNLGVIFESEGREEEAVSLFRQAIETAPDYAAALNNLGAILARRGKLDEAIGLHRRAVAADPTNAAAHDNLGNELAQSGQLDEGVAQLSQALRLDPDSARAEAEIGAVLGLKGNLEEASQHLQQAVRLEPNNIEAERNLCVCFAALNHPDQAIIACNATLKIRPDLVDIRFLLGSSLAAKGQAAAAKIEFSRVLAANPNHTGARTALARLQRTHDR